MKKRWTLLFLLVVAVMAVLCACELNGECLHEFDMWSVIKEADCAGPGTQSRRCTKCGYLETAEITASVAHKEEILAAVDATCTESGLTEGKRCSVCYAELLAQQVIPATGHTEVTDAAVAATCTESGLTEGKHCSVCEAVTLAQETVAANGHTEVIDAAVAATCTEDGLTEGKHCAVCETVLLAQETVKATGHVLTETLVREATCAADGEMLTSCENCNYSFTTAVVKPSYTAVEINNMAVSAVGEILTYDAKGNALALGSCFVYSADGTIVTNYHVIERAYSAKVTINNVSYDVVSVLAYSEMYDLAVLKINATGLTVLPICSEAHSVGEVVYAIGSSQGLTATFSQGIITHAIREVDGVLCVQHDAAISSGNSGGPLINRFGEIIGVNTFYISNSQNLNFAVSVAELQKLDYSNPVTMEQLYAQKWDAFKILKEMLMSEGTYDSGINGYQLVMGMYTFAEGDTLCRYLEYSVKYDEVELCILYNTSMQFKLYMSQEKGIYMYTYVDVYEETMYGYFDPATYVYNSDLTYVDYTLTDSATAEELLYYPSTLAAYLYYFLGEDLAQYGFIPEDVGFVNYG